MFSSQIGGFLDSNSSFAHAHWENYQEFERFLGNESCFLFSHPETSLGYQYELSAELNAKQENPDCPDALKSPICGQRHASDGNFNACYFQNGLTLPEAIYWHAAQGIADPAHATPNILAALQQSYNELLSPQTAHTAELERASRGNLWQSNLRHVVVLTDHLPRLDEGSPKFSDLLEAFRLAHIQITFIAFQHPELSTGESQELDRRATELQAMQALSAQELHFLQVRKVASPEALETQVLPFLVQSGRQTALRS